MSDFGGLTLDQVNDLGNKIGGQAGAKRILSGEVILVEKDRKISVTSLANGGVTYTPPVVPIDIDAFRRDWERHFLKVYDRTVDLSGVQLPPFRQGFSWGIVRIPDLSAQEMFEILTHRFNGKTWKWYPNIIDEALNSKFEVRTTADGPYVVWLRDRVEADEEHKKCSTDDLIELGVNCITEPERIALEGWFEERTNGSHLDIKNVTLSAGSRWSDGFVPNAYWYTGDGFCVSRCSVDRRLDFLRTREVVSLPTCPPKL